MNRICRREDRAFQDEESPRAKGVSKLIWSFCYLCQFHAHDNMSSFIITSLIQRRKKNRFNNLLEVTQPASSQEILAMTSISVQSCGPLFQSCGIQYGSY
jgi:hypothetical protein